jgi:hypothetical protein
MGGKDFIAAVLIVFLSLWSMLYLETSLKSYFMPELLIILVFLIVSTGILYSILTGKEWAWNAAAVFFFAAIVNSILLYFGTKSLTPFLVALFSNLAGLALAGSNAVKIEPISNSLYEEKNEIFDALETYDLQTDNLFDNPKARKKSAKKSGGKKKKPKRKSRTSKK